ncbi:autotransporter assembly complex protein TamA [Roseateles saccharophilus]|uniref:Autotransporter secretion outer membrane protein TamA n=1 Tax=Roseateles saccharophilus TaxID=304 RepID=A0A4R3USP5_ROSSA|nr:BamA/TamA family outer membrane protein [Roseateles saccharophilus]MDG0833360.1 outer membrane protein assembly factor [Roseateles saccharophilus]TCU93810.1 autotransporter secretion outer membrane protein TamA [Roseateles saccharophilus]
MTRLVAALLLMAVLSGCATKAPAPQAQPAPDIPADAPAVYSLDIRVDGERAGDLRALLQQHLDLARYRASEAALSRVELARLAAAAPAQAEALLETEGYFNAKAEVSHDPDDATRLRLVVRPGPVMRVGKLELEFTEGLAADEVKALRDSLRQAWPLKEGAAFTQSQWAAGKSDLLLRARTGGFPLAQWGETAARVDPEAQTAELHLALASGNRARLGALRIEGLKRQNRETVERLAGFATGDAYTEQKLAEFQERLAKTQLFDAVRVQLLADAPDADGSMPVQVSVTESALQQATVAVGYHSNNGQSISVEHMHRRPFDLPVRARSKLQLSRALNSAELELSSHPQPDLHRNLASMQFEQDHSADTVATNLGLRLGRLYESTQDERLSYVELLRARETTGGQVNTNLALSVNQQWIRRRLDSSLLPTDGYQGLALVGLGYAHGGGSDDSGPFARLQLKLGAYKPLGANWYGSARAELGQVVAHDLVGVPEKLLFLAGGDDSVRGYAYRSLGPQRNGLTVGGRVLATGSLEIARPFTMSFPSLWGALFVDAGNAASRWADYHAAVGVGAGLRWRSPVGPLRVDFARAQETGKWRLHFSVGITL